MSVSQYTAVLPTNYIKLGSKTAKMVPKLWNCLDIRQQEDKYSLNFDLMVFAEDFGAYECELKFSKLLLGQRMINHPKMTTYFYFPYKHTSFITQASHPSPCPCFKSIVLNEAFGSQECVRGSTPCLFVSELSKNSLQMAISRCKLSESIFVTGLLYSSAHDSFDRKV